MNYLDRPLVVELAQLALDVYNSPNDDNLRKNEFNPLWIRKDQWPRTDDRARRIKITPVSGYMSAHGPSHLKYNQGTEVEYDAHTGFYAAFYEHMVTRVGVFVIRGTDPGIFLDLVEDANYVFNKAMEQYEEAKLFCSTVKKYSGLKKIYACGHSLGGIIAKMIAPVTGLDTVAFNSPGVLQYLKTNHLPFHLNYDRETRHLQRALTYCAKADPIGNLRHDNDFEHYKFVDVLGGEQIPEEYDRIDGKKIKKALYDIFDGATSFNTDLIDKGISEIPNYDKIFFKNRIKYHAMIDMYEALKVSKYQHDAI